MNSRAYLFSKSLFFVHILSVFTALYNDRNFPPSIRQGRVRNPRREYNEFYFEGDHSYEFETPYVRYGGERPRPCAKCVSNDELNFPMKRDPIGLVPAHGAKPGHMRRDRLPYLHFTITDYFDPEDIAFQYCCREQKEKEEAKKKGESEIASSNEEAKASKNESSSTKKE